MMKSRSIAVCASVAAILSACTTTPAPEGVVEPDVAATSTASSIFIDWTNAPIDARWYVSNHNMPDGHVQSDLRSDNVSAIPSGLNIKLTRKNPVQREWDWSGGEVQFRQKRGFGEYHVIMKAAKGSGLVTQFFTHTGPYYGDPKDEIDLSFVGQSPYEVQLNLFSEGRGMGAIKYPLDFDTSGHYALYSIIWEPERVVWSVNGEFAYEITSEDFPIPQRPGKLFANLSVGQDTAWVGDHEFEEGATAIFRCMSYRELDDKVSRTCADEYITAE